MGFLTDPHLRPGGLRACPSRLRLKAPAHVSYACFSSPGFRRADLAAGGRLRDSGTGYRWRTSLLLARCLPVTVGPLGERDARDDGDCLPAAAAAPPNVASLYRSQRSWLLRFFSRRTADPQEAQDLVQETFVRMIGVDAGPDVRKPEAYLTRIAQNLLRDRAKMRVRRSASAHIPADDANLAGTDQNRLLETRDLLDRLDRAMLELAPATREVFMAHRLEGLTYAEIAERTGLTIKQVEKAISRSLLELDRALGPRGCARRTPSAIARRSRHGWRRTRGTARRMTGWRSAGSSRACSRTPRRDAGARVCPGPGSRGGARAIMQSPPV